MTSDIALFTSSCLSLCAGRPRIALTLAYADPSFERPYFDHAAHLPFPPLTLRLGLVAGQQIQYEHLEALDKHKLGLYRRIFHRQRDLLSEEYFEKISSASQFLSFKLKNKQSDGGIRPMAAARKK
jgi:hypothetical protein